MAARRSIRMILSLAVCTLALGCGGGSPTDLSGGGGGNDTRSIKADPSFSTDVNEIFQRRGCTASSCHGGGQAGLVLGASASANYSALVSVSSTSEPAFLRVKPGDAQNSYLVIKLEGRQTVGQRMPRGMTPLDDIDLTNIKNWINNGASNN